MARMYKVSADVSEKEKAVGGIMTFGQAGWLVLGFLNSRASAWDWIWVCLCLLQKGRTSALHLHPLQEIL